MSFRVIIRLYLHNCRPDGSDYGKRKTNWGKSWVLVRFGVDAMIFTTDKKTIPLFDPLFFSWIAWVFTRALSWKGSFFSFLLLSHLSWGCNICSECSSSGKSLEYCYFVTRKVTTFFQNDSCLKKVVEQGKRQKKTSFYTE